MMPEPQSSLVCPQTASLGAHRCDTECCGRSLGCARWEGRFAAAHSRWSQAPSHTLSRHLPFLSSLPTSRLPLPAQAKLHLGKLRAHHLLLLRSP